MRINIARRGSALWQACADLAKDRYARDYQARIDPSPDCFIALCAEAGTGTDSGTGPVPLACAGLTYGGGGDLLVESYLGGSATDILAARSGRACEPTDLIEVGPLASREAGAGRQLIRMVPALVWCNGASYLLCTVTTPLARMLDRIGIRFTGLTEARENALPPAQRGRWGTYYDTAPVAGYIDLTAFDAGLGRQADTGYHLAVTWGQDSAPVRREVAAR
ncbi:thermostable hemolysin [Streptomyces sp. NPDC052676]|uniref:thermostable hemolysin n=1 Tax=Streptomyces sp. NPDC052676 TaxID=3154953 RepID=UPI003426B913